VSAPADISALRIRQAARAFLRDDDDRFVLVRFEFPTATRWALPGGGLEPGEDHAAALRRELREELGLAEFDIGAHLWQRTNLVPHIDGRWDGQRDEIFEVRVPAGTPLRPQLSWEQLRAEFVHEIRWWHLHELEAAGVPTAPSALRSLIRDLLDHGAPSAPIVVDP
jgi:8-oxo-dGTP pyrophosphatase MutT (NUDIX family)